MTTRIFAGASLPISKSIERCREDYAADHEGLSPWEVIWRGSDQWDESHANCAEIWASEVSTDQIDHALKLHKADSFEAAFEVWRELAEVGSVWSMCELGRCYEFGCGVDQDGPIAEQWYKHAADRGYQLSMLFAARLAARREGYEDSEMSLRRGVDQNWAPALFWTSWYRYKRMETKETYRSILPLLREAARQGHPAAHVVLGNFMARGKFGFFRIPLGFYHALRNPVVMKDAEAKVFSSS